MKIIKIVYSTTGFGVYWYWYWYWYWYCTLLCMVQDTVCFGVLAVSWAMVILSIFTTSCIFITLTGLTSIYVEIGSNKPKLERTSPVGMRWTN
jgi:hypothetical protein